MEPRIAGGNGVIAGSAGNPESDGPMNTQVCFKWDLSSKRVGEGNSFGRVSSAMEGGSIRAARGIILFPHEERFVGCDLQGLFAGSPQNEESRRLRVEARRPTTVLFLENNPFPERLAFFRLPLT
jgi:hypothetical protein